MRVYQRRLDPSVSGELPGCHDALLPGVHVADERVPESVERVVPLEARALLPPLPHRADLPRGEPTALARREQRSRELEVVTDPEPINPELELAAVLLREAHDVRFAAGPAHALEHAQGHPPTDPIAVGGHDVPHVERRDLVLA